MGLADIESMTKDTINCTTAASVLGCNPQLLRIQARQCPQALGFQVIAIGNHAKIPRRPFIAFMRGDAAKETAGA